MPTMVAEHEVVATDILFWCVPRTHYSEELLACILHAKHVRFAPLQFYPMPPSRGTFKIEVYTQNRICECMVDAEEVIVGLFALPCSFRSPFVDSTCSLYGRPVRAAIQLLLVKLIKTIVIYLD